MARWHSQDGFSLIELTVLLVVVAVLAGVAMKSMTTIITDTRRAKTEREMEVIATAIVGEPSRTSGGKRSDFGYVGDMGAFPPDLQSLSQNTGGWATWDGPYIKPGFVENANGFQTDEWGRAYAYTPTQIVSSGPGGTIQREIANDVSNYLHNRLDGIITDDYGSGPGAGFIDSVQITMLVPDGAGAIGARPTNVGSDGTFAIDSLPVGTHELRVIYVPNLDTLRRLVTILPNHKGPTESFKFATNYFTSPGATGPSSTGLTLVPGSVAPGVKKKCNRVYFSVENTGTADIEISSLRLDWSNPKAYYHAVYWDKKRVFNRKNPRAGSGETVMFSKPRTAIPGEQILIRILAFKKKTSGGGKVNMDNTALTVTFSDGSSFGINTGECVK